MITIPLYSFLFLYFGFLLFWVVFIGINLGHLFHTGTFTLASFFASFFFLAFSTVVLWGTWNLALDTNWQQPVILWSNAWFGSVFTPDQIFSPFQ